MMPTDLLRECFAANLEETWERERTANALMGFAVRFHTTGCSLRETASILAELGVERSHGAVWNWVHRIADSVPDPPTAKPSRVAVDETAIKINGEWPWLYAAIDIETNVESRRTVVRTAWY
jgi:putative transposase